MKLLLYCTKAKPYLRDYRGKAIYNRFVISPTDRPFTSDDTQPILNGKIVAECDFEVEEIDTMALSEHVYDDYYNDNIDRISKESCLTCKQMCEYLGTTWDSKGYAIHIKNLHIFDEPRALDDCEKESKPIFDFTNNYYDDNYYELSHITKAPQNMCKVKLDDKPYILISIRPEWLCKILNSEKIIEVRKKVLKEMLK